MLVIKVRYVCRTWEGDRMDESLGSDAWEIVASSSIPYMKHSQIPRQVDEAGMAKITNNFVATV